MFKMPGDVEANLPEKDPPAESTLPSQLEAKNAAIWELYTIRTTEDAPAPGELQEFPQEDGEVAIEANEEVLVGNSPKPGDLEQSDMVVPDAENADTNNAPNNVGTMEAEDSSDDEELFVQQWGQVKEVDGIIDLTEETEAESDARALRVSQIRHEIDLANLEDPEPEVKVEDDDSSSQQDSDSEYLEDSDKDEADTDDRSVCRRRPAQKAKRNHTAQASRTTQGDDETANFETQDDLEDAIDKRQMLLIKKRMLERRKAKDGLSAAERKKLQALDRQVAELDTMISSCTKVKDEAPPPEVKFDEVEAPLSAGPEQEARTACEVPSAETAFERKRKTGGTHSDAGENAKKPRLLPVAENRPRRRLGAQKRAEILGMLQNRDTITGQEMESLPVLIGFEAATAAEQARQFRELASNDPSARGDRTMVIKARAALKGRVKVVGEKFLVKGMKTPLPAYQFAGVGWMIGRERSSEKPNGGILADSMGLGKTVQTLACIVGNPPSEEDKAAGLQTTLVVAPANAVGQWIEEVIKHCCDSIRVCHYKQADVLNQAIQQYSHIW